MWLNSIVARAHDAGNAEDRPRSRHTLAALWRRGGLIRTCLLILICTAMFVGVPLPLSGMLLPVTMLFIGEVEMARKGISSRMVNRLIAWRVVNTLIAATTLLVVTHESWPTTAALGLLVVSCSGALRGRGLALVALIAGVANVLLPIAVVSLTGIEPLVSMGKALAISLVAYPSVAILLHLRSHRLLAAQQQLSETIVELESAQLDLRTSEQRLQEWNQKLNASIESQTAQLEERNRYLSIINAVSFALAEPMDDFHSLERASRLVARLMGARGAQAFHRFGVGDAAHLFVTVAPEDVHAPRLPETLLRRVADTGMPVIWSSATEQDDLPDLGEPYAIVPIAARGQVSGAFALLGTGEVAWADQERHLLLLIGREMGFSLENMRLYREAIERVRQEEIAGGAARLLDVPDHREHAVHQALALVGQALDAWDMALVTIDDAPGAPPTLFASLRADGAGNSNGDGSWIASILDTLPAMIAGRTAPVILGAGGEAPLAEAIEVRGIGMLVLVPVVSMRRASVLPVRDAAAVSEPSFERVVSGVILVAVEAGVRWRPTSTELVSSFAYSLARRLESDELVALQRQRIRELTGLADVARTMQSGADVDRLYTGFAHALTGLLDYRRLYLARVDEFGQVGEALAMTRDGVREDRTFAVDDSAHRWFQLRAPLTWDRESGPPPTFADDGEGRYLVLPMRPKGQVLGLAAFAVSEEVVGDQLSIVEQAVEQLALALDSATLYQQATERASHIQAFSNLARIVASVVDLREAFAAFAEEVRWLIPFDRAVMLLLNETETAVQPYATYPEDSLHTSSTPLGGSIASAVIEVGAAVLMRRSDPEFAHLDWEILGPDTIEVAAVPVRNGVRTAAVFALVHIAPTALSADLNALDEVAGLLGVTIERLRLYERAEHSANHDLLTGLPNYRYLQERLYNLQAGITGPGETAVLMIDMDGLKLFNDTLGHEAGDQVIRIVARVLNETCRAEDFVARTGGDEFVVVMEGVGPEEATRAASRIHNAIRDAHLEVPGAPARLGLSIGIAIAPTDASAANRLLHAADQAMYAAKFSGGHRTRLAHDPDVGSATRSIPQRDTRLVETMIRTATDGATSDERSVIAIAQRWVVGATANLLGAAEAAPWVRMVVVHEALGAVDHVRKGPDQEMARFFLDRVRREWADRPDEVAQAAVALAPLAVRMARAHAVFADSNGQALNIAVRDIRQELGDRITPLHEALFTFAVEERFDRRRERDAA